MQPCEPKRTKLTNPSFEQYCMLQKSLIIICTAVEFLKVSLLVLNTVLYTLALSVKDTCSAVLKSIEQRYYGKKGTSVSVQQLK